MHETDHFKPNNSTFQDKELLSLIAQHGIVKNIKAGDTILDYGQFIKSVPLIVSGCIKIVRQDEEGHELFLYYLYAGETCAMSLTCCMANQKSEIKAVAEEDTHIIFIPMQYLDEWMLQFSEWKNFIMNTYSVRFRDLLNTIDHIAFKKMDERLEAFLTEKTQVLNNKTIAITHQEIAIALNTSREVISRLLKQLEKQRKIVLGRNKIEVL